MIGAGFAGLACADRLVQLGHDVTVLEARDRVGGRVWSQELIPGQPRTVVERGAEFVLNGYDVLTGMARRWGLELAPSGMSYYVREPRRTSMPITADEVAATVRALQPLVADTPTSTSLREFLDRTGIAAAAVEAIAARAAISCAASEEVLSAHVLLDELAGVQPQPTYRVAGGNQRIASAMAAALGDRVRLTCPASAVRAHDDGVTVHVPGTMLEADAVVLAIPLPLLERFDVSPGLPDPQRAAMSRMVRGHAAKLHAPLNAPAPTSAVLDASRRFWCWTATDASGQVQPVVHAFSGSPAALDGLCIDAGAAEWTHALQTLRPDLDIAAAGALLSIWDDDPWATMAESGPGVLSRPGDDDLVRAAIGRIHVAGELTAGPWAGLMEGALRSGLRAADEVHHG